MTLSSIGLDRSALRSSVTVLLVGVIVCSMAATPVAGASNKPVDIVFVVDRTNSMDWDISTLNDQLGTVDDRLGGEAINPQYALITYGKTPSVDQEWTTDVSDIEGALDESTSGYYENASDAIEEAQSLEGRSDAERVIVVVTDEDDDSSSETRAEVKESLSGSHLIVVSPASPATSSCEFHDPPCDSASANELRTIAEDVGGDWIDHSDIEAAVDEVASTIQDRLSVESETDGNGDDSDDTPGFGDSDGGDDIDLLVRDLHANRSSVEVGDAVEYTVRVKNVAYWPVSFEVQMVTENSTESALNATIPMYETRTIRFNHTFENPGNYELQVRGESGASVNVTPLGPTAVSVAVEDEGRRQIATVENARIEDSVRVPVSSAPQMAEAGVDIEAITVTPDHQSDFELMVEFMGDRPADTTQLPAHVRPVFFFEANSTLSPAAFGVADVAFNTPSSEAYLYHFDEDRGDWRRINRSVLNETESGFTFSGTVTELSAFAVGVQRPEFVITDVDLDASSTTVGESVQTTVRVENRGPVDGTYHAELRANGRVVASKDIVVGANQSRTVRLPFRPDESREYILRVGDSFEDTVTVTSQTTSGTTSTSGQPGFGAPLVVFALLAVLFLQGRCR